MQDQQQKKNNKTVVVLLSLTLVLLIALIGVSLWFFVGSNKAFYAVYLNTGELYFGKLSRFPSLSLSNVLLLQTNQNGEPVIVDFQNSLWGPEGTLKLNKNQVMWFAKVSDTSLLLPALQGESINNPAPTSPSVPSPKDAILTQ